MQCERKPIDDFCDILPSAKFFSHHSANAGDHSQKSDDTNEDFRLEGVSALPAFIDSRREGMRRQPHHKENVMNYVNTHKPPVVRLL